MNIRTLQAFHRISQQIRRDLPVQNAPVPPALPNPISIFDLIITDTRIRSACRGLYNDGYYALAVEECCKSFANEVKDLSGIADKDGQALMFAVFNGEKPVLALNGLRTISEKDEQRGYMYISAGVMAGVRNPRVHEHEYLDDPNVALELIALVQHLRRKTTTAKRLER